MYQISKIYWYCFSIGIQLFIFSSCSKNSKHADIPVDSHISDSIASWVTKGMDRGLDKGFRLSQLKKATVRTKEIEHDSLKLEFFSLLSLAYLEFGDSLNFRQTNSETMELAKILGDSMKQAEAHWDLAEFYRANEVSDSTYYHFSKAQIIYNDLGSEFESGKMLYNMAIAQAEIKDYTGSEINNIKAIEVLKPLNANKQLYSCYNILGVITKELKEYERAIEYFNTAFEYQKKVESENVYDLTLANNIGNVYLEQGKYKEALPYFKKVLSANSILGKRPQLYALALNNHAYAQLKLDKKVGLLKHFERALKIQDSIGEVAGLTRTHYCLAEYYLTEKDTLKALAQAKTALQYAESSQNNERILETLQILVKLEPEKSIAYNREYITLNDSLQQEERKARNKFARIRFETDEFIAENKLLAREKQLWAGIAVAVLLLGLMSYFIVDQRAKNQKLRFQQEQQAANQEIFDLMLAQKQKVEEVKKAEQKRISEELHDGVLGRMLGARMVLTGLNKKSDSEAEKQRKKAIDALQDVEKEVRVISHELSHAAYQKIHNFIHSLEDLLKTVQTTGKFNHTFNYNEEFDWDGLNGETKINVYRMIQESLQNCIKHSKCENVAINLLIINDVLKVTVSDDGKGFKTNTGKKGIGMRNISSRINKLNGEWNIESSLDKGTTVTLVVPLVYTRDEKSKLIEKEHAINEV